MKIVDKAVPVVVRWRSNKFELLVFDHPLAGRQLVKGTIEEGESAEAAAVRELFEESGLEGVSQAIFLGVQEYVEVGQRWHFFQCVLDIDPPENWEHFTSDGGGLTFKFCWQPLEQVINNPIGPVFEQARRFVAEKIGRPRSQSAEVSVG